MKKLIYTICSAVLFFACNDETDVGLSPVTPNGITLNMQTDHPDLQSRADEPGDDQLNENRIRNMHVFFFPQNAADNQSCLKYESATGLSFQGTGVFAKTLTTPQTFFSAGVTYDIYTIVNLPADVTIPANPTLGTLKSLRTQTPITATALQSDFVMDSKTSAILNPTQQTPMVYVSLPQSEEHINILSKVPSIQLVLHLALGD